MRALVLGGSGWLGRLVAESARDRGDAVTCVARGTSGLVPDGVAFIHADRDRDDAIDEVASREWDYVVDVARQPGHVRRAAYRLAKTADHYLFVSSGSVYADTSHAAPSEDAQTVAPLDRDVMESMESYGPAKVACEQHVLGAFGADRCILARSGLIGGPGDETTRSGYWPLRFARPSNPQSEVLVPDAPDLLTQLIDVRDLATWLVDAGRNAVAGTMNLVGEPIPLAEHLAIAQRVAGFTGTTINVDQDWLEAHDVNPWMGPRSLPLWLPLPEYAGFSSRDGSKARAAGLEHRPLADTLADTLAWELTRSPDAKRGAGLTDAEERQLLGRG